MLLLRECAIVGDRLASGSGRRAIAGGACACALTDDEAEDEETRAFCECDCVCDCSCEDRAAEVIWNVPDARKAARSIVSSGDG